ncbi:hypothetical protein [Hoeflea sp.]|uniref:hypothetical protein n=1 Tax=Hoeflea sp. TaxID=1940281 RepID=UPI003A92416B
MIVGSHLVSIQSTLADRPAPARASAAAPAQNDDTSDPLTKLDNFVESAALSRKAFAEDRLKHLKEQMNTLALFNLAPGFLAGHTARMAKELESAATDFATAFKTLAGLEQPSKIEQPAGNPLPAAYLDILAEDAPVNARLNTQDMETAASFMDTAYQLRAVVEMISGDSPDDARLQWSTDSAKASTSRVSSIMARLEGPSAFNKVFW